MVLPLEITLPSIDDPEMREGCTQIYNFTHELFEDMYNNPEKYEEKSPHIYSVYLLDRKMKEGADLDESGGNWIISEKSYSEKNLSCLSDFGFAYSAEKGNYVITNNKYPLLLKYWHRMWKKGPFGNAQKRLGDICACDFRIFSKDRKAKKKTIEEILRTLSDRNRPYFIDLHNYATDKGAKLEATFDGCRYRYKNEWILSFNTKFQSTAVIPLSAWKVHRSDHFELFISEVQKQSDKDTLNPYIQNAITLCSPDCQYTCSGKPVEIESVRKILCVNHYNHAIGKLDVMNPDYSDEEITMLKRMIDIRCTYQVCSD